MACSFYGAQAVIGPTWCNFHDLCQLPLLVFLLLLGLLERRWWLLLLAALLIPLVREDTGVVLFGMALWMACGARPLVGGCINRSLGRCLVRCGHLGVDARGERRCQQALHGGELWSVHP